jgi:methionyl-tRNA synthetase
MLHAAGFKLPSRVVVHGMLLANGEKMSKSRGTGINARDYLNKLDPMYLRYFVAANLGPSPEDIDLSLEEFRNRVNADLVNNFGNLANRALSILKKNFGGKLAPTREWGEVKLAHARALAQKAAEAFGTWETREAVRVIKEIGDWANKAIADAEPWKQLAPTADAGARAAAHVQVSFAAEAAALIGALLQPVVPGFAANLFKQLNVAPITIAQVLAATGPLLPVEHEIGEPAPLAPRLDPKLVDTLFSPPTEAPAPKPEKKAEAKKEPPKKAEPPAVIQYDDFGKLDLRVGRVLSCSKVEKADKLLQFSIDLGEAAPRTIVSGIAKHYAPEQLVGKQVVIVANLAPREFKKQGLTSHGMILSAATGEGDAEKLTVVEIPASVPPGSKVA